MKIIVTGHCGYIGSEIYFTLKAMGLKPVGIDIQEGNDVKKHMPKSDLVIHCAAQLGGRDVYKENIDMMKAVIRSTKKVIFLSSAAVYGNNKNAIEEDPLQPINEYGKSKVACEGLLQKSKKKYLIFRLSNVYSLHAKHGVFAKFLHGYRTIYGNGKQVRDFVLLSDVVSCIVDAVMDKWEGIYNVSSGKGTRINTLFQRFFMGKPSYLPQKEEIRYSVLNNYELYILKNKKFTTL